MKENPDEELKDQLKEQFNFEQRTIQKESGEEETKQQVTQNTEEGSTQQAAGDGFFDAISSSTLETDKDRAANREQMTKDRDQNRKKDSDTFGQSMSNNFQY